MIDSIPISIPTVYGPVKQQRLIYISNHVGTLLWTGVFRVRIYIYCMIGNNLLWKFLNAIVETVKCRSMHAMVMSSTFQNAVIVYESALFL
jgi:hypothetical protein